MKPLRRRGRPSLVLQGRGPAKWSMPTRARRDGKPSTFLEESNARKQPFRLALKDGQVIVGYLQDDQGHGRSVFVADTVVSPKSRRRLAMDEFVTNGRIPFRP